jgi:adenine-specific DNA methylase
VLPLLPADKAKAFGAYYTDEVVAKFLVHWAVRESGDHVIDPSSGGGVFLEAALKRLAHLSGQPGEQVYGVELDPEVHATVGRELAEQYQFNASHLIRSDFFGVDPGRLPVFDAVVGNPPFIRYQSFSGAGRAKALARARAQGVELNRLSSSWAPFLVHSTALLRPGGRLAMVVPMELGHAGYAQPVLRYLTQAFRRITLLSFKRPLFPDLSQDTMLVLAEGKGEAFERLELCDLSSIEALKDLALPVSEARLLDHAAIAEGRDRLITGFIDPRARDLYRLLASSPGVVRLGEVADVGIGYVSGGNSFFHLSPENAKTWGLPASVLARAVFRGRAFPGIRFTPRDWHEAARNGHAGYLFLVGKQQRFGQRAKAYIEHGERAGVHQAYKCRVRTPWYSVPNAYMPDAYLTYMSGLRPTLVANDAKAYAPNTLHVIRLKENQPLSGDALAVLWQSSLTGLSAEIEGHAMGGGMLKLEPTEAQSVILPLPGTALGGLALEVDELLRAGRREDVRERVDTVLLKDTLGLSASEIGLLRDATAQLQTRRYYRGRFA